MDVEPEATVTTAQESMHEAHELTSALDKGGILVDERDVGVCLELTEALLHERSHFLEPSDDEFDHHVEELYNFFNLFL